MRTLRHSEAMSTISKQDKLEKSKVLLEGLRLLKAKVPSFSQTLLPLEKHCTTLHLFPTAKTEYFHL
jgi:hypothetical protein